MAHILPAADGKLHPSPVMTHEAYDYAALDQAHDAARQEEAHG